MFEGSVTALQAILDDEDVAAYNKAVMQPHNLTRNSKTRLYEARLHSAQKEQYEQRVPSLTSRANK